MVMQQADIYIYKQKKMQKMESKGKLLLLLHFLMTFPFVDGAVIKNRYR